ncbi:MAG: SDR family oxidoreductase [Gaiellales bacterium]
MTVLVTGGTGHLGRKVVELLVRDGHRVRVLARHPTGDRSVTWIQGDLATGEGIAEAVSGVETIVHAATNSPAARRGRIKARDLIHSPADVDIRGTAALMSAAAAASVDHVVHVSIVGLEHTRRLPYSRVKLRAEGFVRSGGVPWSIARATPFYWLMERLLDDALRRPVVMLPRDVRWQCVDSDEFARFLVACVTDGQRGDRMDFAGPEALTMREMAEPYVEARGIDKRIRSLPLPDRVERAMTAANTSASGHRGMITWSEWLERTSGDSDDARLAA